MTTAGERCVFPFTYLEMQYDTCIGYSYLWCATAPDYSYFNWGRCVLGKLYDESYDILWCLGDGGGLTLL